MPTSPRLRVNNIPWCDTCVQSVLLPGMASNACGFSSLFPGPGTLQGGDTHAAGTRDSLSQRHLGLVCGGEHMVFRPMVLPSSLAG